MDIIKLASFDFDSDRLEKGIEELQKQLFDLTKRQQELNNQSKEVNKTLAEQTKEQERLVQNFKNGSHEYQKAVQEQYKLRKAGQENTKAYKDLNAEKKLLVATFKEENRDYQQASQSITQLTGRQESLFLSTKDLQIQRSALNKEYQTATTLYKSFMGVNGEVLSLQEVINQSVKQEVVTREQAKAVNIQLNKIKDQLNVTNEAEKQLLDEINKRVDANNKLLKETGSENEKRIAGIGQYSKGIEEAADNLNIFNGGLSGFIQRSQEAGGAGNLVTNSFKAMASGLAGVTKASLTFIATPIGAVLTVIAGLFLLVKNAMSQNEESANKLGGVFTQLGKVFSSVLKFLEPLGTFLIDGLAKGFEIAMASAQKAIQVFSDIAEALGLDGIAEGLRIMNEELTTAGNESARLVQINNELLNTQADYNREAGRLTEIFKEQNKIAEDSTKSQKEREAAVRKSIEASEKLQKIEVARLELEKERAMLEEDNATKRDIIASEYERKIKERNASAIEAQTTQNNKLNTIRQQTHDKQVKAIDAEIKKQKEQLDLWIAQQGDKARTLQEQLQLQEETAKKSIAILDNELKNKKISQEKYDLEVLKLTQDTAKLQAQIAVQLAEDNLETYIYENKSRLENGQLLTDELLQQEIDRNKALQAERDAFAQTQFDNGLINQREYDQALIANQRTYLEEEKALKKQYAEDQRDIDALRRAEESQKIILELEGRLASEAEIKKAQAQFEFEDQKLQLEMQRADGLITEENYQLALNNIIAANAQIRKQIEEDTQRSKLELFESVFVGMSQAVSEHTALAKAAGIATATINTWQGVSEVWKSPAVFPEPYNTILKGIQTGVTIGAGFNAVRNITKTKTPENKSKKTSSSKKMAKGGLTEIGGKLHSQGGTKFYGEDGTSFEAEKGELIGVMNRAAAANFMNYNNSFLNNGAKTYPNFFANGGFVGVKASNLLPVQQGLFGKFDVNTIADAVKQGALEGTQEGSFQGSQQGTAVGSQQGISQLSQDRSAQSNSYI